MVNKAKAGSWVGLSALVGGAIFLLTRKPVVAEPPPEPPAGKANLYGVVTDYVTGQPTAGVAVVITVGLEMGRATDSSGRYSFTDIEPGDYQMYLSKQGYVSKGGLMVTLQEGNNELNIQLEPAYVPPALASLYGVVTDAETSQPISDVKVTVGTVVSYTDSRGAYDFTDITPGVYAIRFEKSGYNTLTL